MTRRPSRSPRTGPPDPAGPSRAGEYPCYTERQARRRARRRPTSLPLSEAVSGLPANVTRYLADSALSDLLEALELSPLERAVAEDRLAGASVREITTATGIKKWRIERALAAIRRKWRAWQRAVSPTGPVRHDAGWQDVYLAETRRRGRQ